MKLQHKIETAIEYINLLNSGTQAKYDVTDNVKMVTLYYQLVDESNINGEMRYIEISSHIHKKGHAEIFEFFDISVIFGRVNTDGNIALFYAGEGEEVRQLDCATGIFPVDSKFSCAHEQKYGIVLTIGDAQLLNIEVE